MKYIHQGYILTVLQYSFNVVNFSNHINIHILHVTVILCGPFRNAKCRFKFIVRQPEIGVKMHFQHTFMGLIHLLSLNISLFSSSGINLSNETKFLPSCQFQRKFVYLNLAALKRKSFTHVVLQVKPTRRMVSVK
jgi:hypothetical protein